MLGIRTYFLLALSSFLHIGSVCDTANVPYFKYRTTFVSWYVEKKNSSIVVQAFLNSLLNRNFSPGFRKIINTHLCVLSFMARSSEAVSINNPSLQTPPYWNGNILYNVNDFPQMPSHPRSGGSGGSGWRYESRAIINIRHVSHLFLCKVLNFSLQL